MNEDDQKMRAYWAKFLWGMTAFNMVTTAFFQTRFDFSMGAFSPAFRYGQLAVMLIVMPLVAYFLYHCAYKKMGTKFLTFCLVVTLLNFVASPAFYFLGMVPFADQIPYYKFYLLIGEAIGIVWFVLCWKMRKLNKKLRAQNL
jgi:hypothetical protein